MDPGYSSYIDALLADLRFELTPIEGRIVESVFIGGGTPSLFPAEQIKRLLDGIADQIACSNPMEATLEANPGTLEAGRYAGYREAGINRLSLGVQSFSSAALRHLGRIHGPDESIQAFSQAREAGFENINLDLMFGLPKQSVEEAGFDLQTAIDLAPEHISYYQLTIEPNTRFAAYPPSLPNDARLWDIQQQGQLMLSGAGYKQYEVSAYSRAERQCRHNLNYWNFGDYLGIGAGAHGKVSDPLRKQIRRRSRIRGPEPYMAAAGTPQALSGSFSLKEADLIIEFMMNLLRLNSGFSEQLFQDRTGLPIARVKPILLAAQRGGLLLSKGESIRPTDLGHRYLNDLLAFFV